MALMDYDSLGSFKSGLGSAAVIVMDKSTDMVCAEECIECRWLRFETCRTSLCMNRADSALLVVRDCRGCMTSCVEWSEASWRSEKWIC